MTIRPFLHPPTPADFKSFPEVTQYTRRMWDSLFQARRGKLEVVGEVTLTANAATTVVNDVRASIQSVLIFDPQTANASTEIHGGTMYVLTANRASKSFTITHANNAQADRLFFYAILG